jgi:uncharacterized protein (DUF58 family)
VRRLRPSTPPESPYSRHLAHALRRWTPTQALGRTVLLVGLLLAGAMLLGQVDLVVIAAPFALGAALGVWRRPSRVPTVRVSTDADFLGEGGKLNAVLTVGNLDEVSYDLVVLRTAISPWLLVPHGDRPYVTAVSPGAAADLPLRGTAVRWGRPALGPAVAHAVAADGLLVSDPGTGRARRIKVYPVNDVFEADDSMPRAAGLIGAHHSRLRGEGGELAGVRMFGPGDRLRRIDWRVSLRTRELYVAATLSDRDAEVVLVLDVLHEAGKSGGIHGARSVLDTTVRAAAGIAEHYLHRGDRVALLEYGFRARRLRAASGRRQYHTVLEWLLDIDTTIGGFEPSGDAFGPHTVSSNALVVVLSPLLDTRAAAMIARFARAGRFVVGIDTLPADLTLPARGDWATAAGRLWKLERENTVGQLREHGVPVVAWAGAGSLDEVLRQVSRMASAPKAMAR